MALSLTVGGARATFDASLAEEVAEVLDHAFGAEGEWEGASPLHYGEQDDSAWADFQRRAAEELGADSSPNLRAIHPTDGGVFLPAHVEAVSLPLPAGRPLRCASLPGLRNELALLAEHWELPLDDESLKELLNVALDPDDGWVADAPEVLAFARLALASNEAVRRDCPLWLVGIAESSSSPAQRS